MKTTRITEKGQVTIPVEVRRALRLSPRDRVQFELDVERGEAILKKAPSAIAALYGSVKTEVVLPEGQEFHDLIARLVAEEVTGETR